MGVASMWHFLLGLPIVAAFLGGFSLMFFFTETPRALIVTNKDEDAAREALIKLRNTHNVQYEIDQINQEQREANAKSDSTSISIFDLFIMRELRWPLITSIIIQVCQQFCGINAVFFYSTKIFRTAGVDPSDIQYMVALTGIVNVLMTLVCVPLIDRLGRKPLLVYPMILIVINFILMTVFLHHQVDIWYYSHLSVGCIMFFICCFAIGLGPIPFIYVAEVFGQNSRSCALAVSMLVNWTANTILTLTFPYLADLLKNDVFIVFTVIVAVAVSVIIKKVPETKGRSVEEIHDQMNGVRRKKQWTEAGKLMTNTSV
jgi:MFS family permease